MRKNFMSESPTLFLALFFLLLLFILAVSLPASQMTHAQTGDGWMTLEDYDAHLVYSPGWQIALPNSNAIGGQLSLTSTAGASVTFQIQVTAATGGYSIRYASGPDGGTFEVRVNNTVRQYSSYSETEFYNREITDGSLPAGMYTITITNGDGTFWLEAVQVKGILAGDSPAATPTPPAEPLNLTPPAFSAQTLQTDPYVIVQNATELVAAITKLDSGGPATIYLASGEYIFTETLRISTRVPVHLYGMLPITVYEPAADGIRLTGPTSTDYPLLYVGGAATLYLHHLRLSSGVTAYSYGGVIQNYGTLTLSDSVIEQTAAEAGAGGILNAGNLSVVRSAFRGNTAGGGGAIQNQTDGTLTAQCSLFAGNEADYGGAILHASEGTLSISHSRFAGNTLTGIYSGVESRDIHNLGYGGSLPILQARNNEWVDGPGVDDDHGDGATIQTSPTLSSNPLLTPDCQVHEPELPCQLVQTSPGLTTEARDMQAVVDPLSGKLMVHAGPTFNAQSLDTLAWDTGFLPDFRYEVYSDTDELHQVWFSPTDSEGWILGWMKAEDDTEYTYVRNHTVCTAPAPTEFTFPYDREAAARYGMVQAKENDTVGRPPFRRVTHYIPVLPFPNFDYSGKGQTGTNSALFTAETIWVGGMPMTRHAASCNAEGDQGLAGWRFCSDANLPSRVWEQHEPMIAYYTGTSAPFPVPPAYNNTVLVQAGGTQGSHVVTLHASTSRDPATGDIIYYGINEYVTVSLGRVRDSDGLNNWISANLSNIRAGDYLLIDPAGGVSHGLLVAGWGPILPDDSIEACETAIANQITMLPTTIEPYKIPYVVDYSYSTTGTGRIQSPVARPFYCTKYIGNEQRFGNGGAHEWYFYRLPDSAVILPEQLYSPTNQLNEPGKKVLLKDNSHDTKQHKIFSSHYFNLCHFMEQLFGNVICSREFN